MNIFHVSAECYPVAKVGGLADVVGALPKYLNLKENTNAKVVLPAYDNKFIKENEFTTVFKGFLKLDWRNLSFTVYKEKSDILGFELYIIAIPELFDRPNVYSYKDDTERFLGFQIAFLNWINETNADVQILHCHDYHSGLIPFMVQNCFSYRQFQNTPTILTIHNGQYQGWFGYDKLNLLPEFPAHEISKLEWKGIINPLASAIKCCWKITTVSPSYLNEISFSANGLENLLRQERHKSIGILNGIDTDVWNPKTDDSLEKNYDITFLIKGKLANKKFLCEQFNLDISKPLFTFIGRLVGEKGADLLSAAFDIILQRNPQQINVLVLGSGDMQVENDLQQLKHKYEGNYNTFVGYNEKLAHIIYAGADFLLMPSRVEPCGLNQMYALRYGTIPIVRRTGGLQDTVLDIGDGGFGICHDNVTLYDINHSVTRAIDLYSDDSTFQNIRKTAMRIDHSWHSIAQQYITVYQSLIQ
ncbi:MAG: starch synthase [Flavobacterium sp.]|jgi:starch synthase